MSEIEQAKRYRAEYHLLALIKRRCPVGVVGDIEVTVFVVLLLFEKIWQQYQAGKNLTGASLV